MRVEMHERERPGARRQRAQQGQGDGVVAAERDEVAKWLRLLLDRRRACPGCRRARCGNRRYRRCPPRRRRAGDRVVAVDQHAAGLADRRRAEARARPVRGAEIIGNAGDADRRGGIAALDAEKARPRRKSRNVAHGEFELQRLLVKKARGDAVRRPHQGVRTERPAPSKARSFRKSRSPQPVGSRFPGASRSARQLAPPPPFGRAAPCRSRDRAAGREYIRLTSA